jgi:hypothetical protein
VRASIYLWISVVKWTGDHVGLNLDFGSTFAGPP